MATRSKKPPAAPPPNLPTVVAQGDRRESLEAIRAVLAEQLDDTGHIRSCECECGPVRDGRVVAQVSKELRETIREIDSMPTVERVTPLDKLAGAVHDDLAKRREDRRAAATGT